MKRIWMGLFVMLISAPAFSQKIMRDLIGKWETTDGVGLEFMDSNRVFIIYGMERKPILSFQADFSKSPCWFDFVVKDTAQQPSKMKSLLLLESGDILKWQVFDGEDRPSYFSADRGDIVVLRRKK